MNADQKRYFIINKPRNMVSQFISSHSVPLLGGLDFDFPKGTHAIGRLDLESEGLLILTTDKTVTRKIFLSPVPHIRSYLVMVQNEISDHTLQKLREGIPIKIKNGEMHIAKPTSLELIKDPLKLYKFAADPREAYPHSWLLITLTEGKFHQARKMVQAIKHRCLRLIRLRISGIVLGDIPPDRVTEISETDFYIFLKENNTV